MSWPIAIGLSLMTTALASSAPAQTKSPSRAPEVQSVPLASRANPSSTPSLFELMSTNQTGVAVVHEFPPQAPFSLFQDQGGGAGLCVGDFDADGWPDLFVANYDRGNHLYRNLGNWRFEDVTARAGVGGGGRWCGGATFVDVDGDGDLDLFVAVFNAPNLLFLNRGDGTFHEQALELGLGFRGASVMMAFADYDLDGWLDGYLVTHRLAVGTDHRLPRSSREAFDRSVIRSGGPGRLQVNAPYQELFEVLEKGRGRMELIIAGQRDHLFHRTSEGRFADVSEAAGIRGNDIGLHALWWDYDDDGRPDLYVSNDYKGPDRLYRNQGDGAFVDVAKSALPHTPWSSMGADVADLNNDGRLDCMATEMSGSTRARRALISGDQEKDRWFIETADPPQYQRNAVYLGTGTERVLEVACLAGLDSTDWTWSPKFADFDNDGWVDLFIANGMTRDFIDADLLAKMKQRDSPGWRTAPVLREANLAFRNLGDLRFQATGPGWGLDRVSASFCATVADFDRDGDLDLVVMNLGEPLSLYRNTGTTGNGVLIRLRGQSGNTWGIGATLRLTSSQGTQTRQLGLPSGFMSANEPIAHFGLGTATEVERLTVRWPDGKQQTLTHLPGQRLYTITETPEPAPRRAESGAIATWFRADGPVPGLLHREADFDDFAREPLLPWKLSRLGPGMAVGDVDGDGDDDVFLGGAAGQSGTLGIQVQPGVFRTHQPAAFQDAQAAEDMGAVFFDLEGDGDLDLYVASGGVECDRTSPLLQDRVYLNDGHGGFSVAPVGTVPEERDANGVVVAADFDRDGDVDLFVGGRFVPGEYPASPRSRLLRNDAGKFTDITETAAPGLGLTGLVTGALWSDADGDGWLDLFVTHEWGPVKLFLNRQGTLVDHTSAAGLAQRRGWWTGVVGRDLDGDGDIDYLVTNVGLNTRYHASSARPALAFYGDFDGRGAKQFIEAEYEGDVLYPLRARNALVAVTPFLAEKFPTHRSFAGATLAEVYPAARSDSVLGFEVNTLESGVLLNDGRGVFAFLPLPRLAQIAPAFGAVIEDFDADGRPDLCLAQNFFSPQPETGRMDGGVGLVLRGRGDGHFDPVWPAESGFVVPGDAKSLVSTDLNADGRPDLLVARNNDTTLAFRSVAGPGSASLAVRLVGARGNPTAVGARIEVRSGDNRRQAAEVYAGSGYLSQSSPRIFFGGGDHGDFREVHVRWPNGRLSSTPLSANQRSVTITQP